MSILRKDGVIILETGEFGQLGIVERSRMQYTPAGLLDDYILAYAAGKVALHIPLCDALQFPISYAAGVGQGLAQGLLQEG